jgi:tRNA-dihydrouridine synthase
MEPEKNKQEAAEVGAQFVELNVHCGEVAV